VLRRRQREQRGARRLQLRRLARVAEEADRIDRAGQHQQLGAGQPGDRGVDRIGQALDAGRPRPPGMRAL
jgi:hypothetical protein